MTSSSLRDENLHHLGKICREYCMDGSEVYGVLISRDDEKFPLSYETIKYMVLKNISLEIMKKIFTQEELKNIAQDTNIKKNIYNRRVKKYFK